MSESNFRAGDRVRVTLPNNVTFDDVVDHGIMVGQWFLRGAMIPVAESWLTKLEPEIAPGTVVAASDDGMKSEAFGVLLPDGQVATWAGPGGCMFHFDHVRPVLCQSCGAAVRVKERDDGNESV